MSDPFASLDPIQKPKTAAERVLTSSPYSHPPPGAPVAVAPLVGNMGMGMRNMNMGNMNMGNMNMGNMNMGMGMGNMNMNMGVNMNMGGMNPGMGGMGMAQPQHNPYQQQQQPVMYDNIKNLLQQKPKAPAGAFEDSASIDFLEHLGGGSSGAKTSSGSFPASNPQVRTPEPTSSVADPFGGGFGSSPVSPSMGSAGDIGLSIFETGGGSAAASSSSASSATAGSKSSALADRLANSRRKTQEAQRSQLALNANSFAHSSAGAPKISLKEMAGQKPSSNAITLDDFASGGSSFPSTSVSSDFGEGADPFGSDRGSGGGAAARHNSGSSARAERTDSGPKFVDENDNTFW